MILSVHALVVARAHPGLGLAESDRIRSEATNFTIRERNGKSTVFLTVDQVCFL
jgi:hypothetical protein